MALAASLKAKICEIYTDVEGVYTADPRIVPEAHKLNEIGYEEMLEMATSGARVMHHRSVELGQVYQHAHTGGLQHGGQARHHYSRREKHGSQK